MAEIDDKFKDSMLNRDEKLEKFDKHGITEDYLLGKLKEELEAAEEFEIKINKKETKTITKPLWKIRQDARKDAHKLKGDYPAEKHEHTGDVIFHSNVPEPDMPKKEKKKPEKEREHPYEDLPVPEQPGEMETLSVPDPNKTPSEFEKEIKPPDHVIEKPDSPKKEEQFKDHHRSRRDAGK